MGDVINDPSKSYHPLNNYNVNNPNGVTHGESDDVVTQYLNDMFSNMSMFQEIIVSFVIVAVSTLIMIYLFEKFNI